MLKILGSILFGFIIIVISIILLPFILAIGIYYYLNGKKGKQTIKNLKNKINKTINPKLKREQNTEKEKIEDAEFREVD